MKLKKVLKRTFILIAVFMSFVAIINTDPFDEKLSKEAQEILKPAPYPQVEGNAYFAIMGLKADPDKDIVEAGDLLIKRYMKNLENGKDELNQDDYNHILGTQLKDALIREEYKLCDFESNYYCLTQFHSINQFYDSKTQVLFDRYKKIRTMVEYQNFVEVGMAFPLPSFSDLLKLSQIQLTKDYHSKNIGTFLDSLHKDFNYWKMMYVQSDFLIDKMMALDGINRDIFIFSEFIREKEADDLLSIKRDYFTMISHADLNLTRTFKSELKFINKTLDLSYKNDLDISNLLFQPNATKNNHIKASLEELKYWNELSLFEFGQKIKAKMFQRNKSFISKIRPHHVYNFIGKMLNSYSQAAYEDYIARGYDTNNMIRMVKIQLQIKTSGLDVMTVLNNPENYNPHTNQPYDYDTEKRILSFDCLESYNECKIKI